uniref:Sen15 domain-containing protein n=1 Tax=Steinernema glaseri TaxID=37863 RepID=A0A1I8AB27_9BILA
MDTTPATDTELPTDMDTVPSGEDNVDVHVRCDVDLYLEDFPWTVYNQENLKLCWFSATHASIEALKNHLFRLCSNIILYLHIQDNQTLLVTWRDCVTLTKTNFITYVQQRRI